MDLGKVEDKLLLDELLKRYDHAVVTLVQDGEGGKHMRRWKGNYHACISMCTIVQGYIIDAYRATMKLVSKEEHGK